MMRKHMLVIVLFSVTLGCESDPPPVAPDGGGALVHDLPPYRPMDQLYVDAGDGTFVPGSDPAFTAFSTHPPATAAFREIMRDGESRYSFILTDLGQEEADAWSDHDPPPTGSGVALQLRWFLPGGDLGVGPHVIDALNGKLFATCSLEQPTSPGATYVQFARWQGGSATVPVCSRAGTVTVERDLAHDRVKLTFDVAFSDGSAWRDRVVYAPYTTR